jgi:hypothetical protein
MPSSHLEFFCLIVQRYLPEKKKCKAVGHNRVLPIKVRPLSIECALGSSSFLLRNNPPQIFFLKKGIIHKILVCEIL